MLGGKPLPPQAVYLCQCESSQKNDFRQLALRAPTWYRGHRGLFCTLIPTCVLLFLALLVAKQEK